MNNERTRLTDEYLDECMSVLDAVIDICDKVKSGGISFSNACASRGLDPLKVRDMLLKNVPKLSGMQMPGESVLSDIYDGYEKFYHIIFGRKDVELPYDYDIAVSMVLARLKLNERDEKIVRCHMGLKPYDYARSFPEVGMEFDVTAERIRQICAKTFRRARSKEYQEILIYGPNKYALMKEQEREREKAELDSMKEEFMAEMEKSKGRKKRSLMDLRKMLEGISVTELDLGTRAENALWRAGVKDVYTLLMFSSGTLERIRTCGKKSAREVTDRLREWVPENCAGMSLETVKECLLMEGNSVNKKEFYKKLEEMPLAGMSIWPYISSDLGAKGVSTVADIFSLADEEIWQMADTAMKSWTVSFVHVARSIFAASYGMTEEMVTGIVRTKGVSL